MPTGVLLPRRFPVLRVSWRHIQLLGVLAAVTTSGLLFRRSTTVPKGSAVFSVTELEDWRDEKLRQAAIEALQQREGTIVIIDPQTGRVRAAVNSQVAFERAFAPGSTIKPFAALAAFRSGLITPDSRTLCREKYAHERFHTVCSHPQHLAPLNPAEAIAYSCNYYFGKLGERLSGTQYRTTLAEFGFGVKTGVNTAEESGGLLGHGTWKPQNALGDGAYLQVTPIQLLMAYAALVNGGHLLTPEVTSSDQFLTKTRAGIQITNTERQVILDGLRGAIRFGTAKQTGLDSLPLNLIGKTGTSTPVKGFRTQGWFVGFAASAADHGFIEPKLGVLVFLRRGHGTDAAAVSRSIFEEYVHLIDIPDGARSSGKLSIDAAGSASLASTVSTRAQVIRVHLAHENTTVTIPLEEYVLGVVATEGSIETSGEALKALAVASRTYVLANLGRHKADGYDFCNTTHCQRFSAIERVTDAVRFAVKETEGIVLRDKDGRLVDSYFSASCGGETANIATLWGARPQAELTGVTDEYCQSMPHSHWTDVISAKDLLRAVRSDPRTDVGNELKDVVVSRRDQTGRAELVTVIGKRQQTVRGWDFKIVVGRALGWNLLKSSRFQISRAGSNFVFRGSGFGHGLGLCQEGAHVMGERGFSYRQILAKYFPGSDVTRAQMIPPSADLLWSNTGEWADPPASRSAGTLHPGRLRIASEHFRVNYPITVKRSNAEDLLQLLETNRTKLLTRPSLPPNLRLPFIEVFLNETTGDFTVRTGLPWWSAAGSQGNRIELQPIALLKRRGILETTLRHELVHKMVDNLGNGRTPRWLAEGLALYLAGEGQMISRFQPKVKMPGADIDRMLAITSNSSEMRGLYAAAYLEVQRLITMEGEPAVWRRVMTSEN